MAEPTRAEQMRTASWFFWSGRPVLGTLPTESEITDATRFAAAVRVQRAFKEYRSASHVRGLTSRRASSALLMTSAARGLVARRRVRQDAQDLVWELFENSIDDETPTTAPRRASKAFGVLMLAAGVLLLARLHGHVLAGRSSGAATTSSKCVTQPMTLTCIHLLDVPLQPNHEVNLKKKSAQSASVQEAITSISQETAHALAQYVNDSIRETSVAAIESMQEAITSISQETVHALAQYMNDSLRETRSTAATTMRQEKIQVLAHLNAAKRVVIMSVQEIGRYLLGLVTGATNTAIKAAEWLKVVLKEQVIQAGSVSRAWHKAVGALLKDTEIFFA